MENKSSRPIFDQNYQIVGNSSIRQFCFWVRMKTAVMGNFNNGPGAKNLIILMLFHYLGKPLFWLRIRLRSQHRLKHKIKSAVSAIGKK